MDTSQFFVSEKVVFGLKYRKASNKHLDPYLIFDPLDQVFIQWGRLQALIEKDGGQINFLCFQWLYFICFFVSLKRVSEPKNCKATFFLRVKCKWNVNSYSHFV